MRKVLLKFLLIFMATYGILLVPQTKFGDIYASFIRSQGTSLFGSISDNGVVKFEPNDDLERSWATRNLMFLYNSKHYDISRATGADYKIAKIYGSWYHDYLLVALLIALIIATPISRKRKLWAMLAGIALIHIYIFFTLYINLLYHFHINSYLDVLNLSAFQMSILEFTHPILRVNNGTGIFVAVIVWLITCFKKEDISKFPQFSV